MAEYKATVEPFDNHGVVLKVDPASLQPGQFQQLFNLSSLQEGALSICRGTQRKNNANPITGLAHTITKLRTSANQASNYRYIGVAAKIYRGLATDAGPFSQIADLDSPTPPTPPGSANLVRWTSQDYATGLSGNPSKYFATSTKMLKDNGTTTQNWGINAPSRPVIAAAVPGRINTVDVAGVGHVTWVSGKQFPSTLEGQKFNIGSPGSEVEYTVATWTDATHLILTGSTGTQTSVRWRVPSTDVMTPYDYLMTFRNDVTGLEGNPSVEMIESKQIPANGSIVTLTTYGTDDPQISTLANHKTIAIYRRGGVFSDGLYRRLGFVTNNGLGAASFPAFVDDVEDSSLINAEILEFDNDPPVSSNLQIPLTATIASANPSVAISTGISTILSLTVLTPAGLTNLSNILRAGTPITVGTGDTKETCIIETVGGGSIGALDVRVWVQFVHQNGDLEPVSADYVVNEPCKLSCQAFGSMFLAGDKNNPHILYKSKTARPESWPIVNLSNGASGNIVVGSPSNPITALSEFNGEVLVMNLSSLNIVRVWNGVMQAPIETPAKRGLLASFAWCKVGNAIWYLAYDGIYSWEGGMEQKRSEAINPIFMGQTVNGIAPMDMSPGNGTPSDPANALQYVNFEYHDHEVNVVYRDTIGNTHRLRYSVIYDRWYIRDDGSGSVDGITPVAVNAMHLDEDTGNLVLGKYVNSRGQTFIEYDGLGSSDSWTSVGTDGGAIALTAFTAFYNLGAPAMNKHYGDLVLELDNDLCVTLTISLYWDFAGTVDGSNANDVIVIPAVTSGSRRTVAIPIKNSAGLLTGHDARALAMKITGSSTRPLTLYSITFNALPLELQQRGRAFDWDDLGWPNEKNLKELFVEYDFSQVGGGGPVTLCMDAKSGIDGTVETLNVQTWSLSGTGRVRQNLAVQKDVILKMVRLRPIFAGTQTQSYMFWDYKFTQDNWPPDVTLATPWENNESLYQKYYQQVSIEIDTGGIACASNLEIDGVVVQALPSFTTTNGLRQPFNVTVKPNQKGTFARVTFTPGTGGKSQIFSHKFVTLPADPGEIALSFPYDDLGHPFDKRLKTITFEYELSGGNPVVIQMDTITGIKGSTINTNVQQFTLDGTGRSKFTAAIALDTICKMIRLYPTAQTFFFMKNWRYVVDKEDMPADITAGTAWDSMGYRCEKIVRALSIEMDTGNVACSVAVQIDGVTAYTFSMTTTYLNRSQIITMPSRPNELIGRLFRLVFTPGSGGKAQYWTHSFSHITDVCPVFHASTFPQNFGSNGRKLAKRLWLEYICSGSITVSIYTDGNALFYQKTLPSHASRDVETFLLPAINNGVLNKSYVYTIDVDSVDPTKPFKYYRDSARIEIKNLAGETRSAWEQKYLWEAQPLDTGGS